MWLFLTRWRVSDLWSVTGPGRQIPALCANREYKSCRCLFRPSPAAARRKVGGSTWFPANPDCLHHRPLLNLNSDYSIWRFLNVSWWDHIAQQCKNSFNLNKSFSCTCLGCVILKHLNLRNYWVQPVTSPFFFFWMNHEKINLVLSLWPSFHTNKILSFHFRGGKNIEYYVLKMSQCLVNWIFSKSFNIYIYIFVIWFPFLCCASQVA